MAASMATTSPVWKRSHTTHHHDPKISKKLNKIARRLSSKESIEFSDSSSVILCVQNGGLGNDVCQEELLSTFSPFGEVENIVMMPKKSFCFAYFTNESTAVAIFENLNGHILKKGQDAFLDVILYFLFVEKVPEHVMPAWHKPAGLHTAEDFISKETELSLLSLMNEEDESDSGSSMKHRRVKHFGYEFRYGTNDVDMTDPLLGGLPAVCHPILKKVKEMGLIDHYPDQLTINQYQPGQGIPPHVDTEDAFEDGIMSISLGSQTVMEFRHPDGKHVNVVLPQRSLMVMSGESRYIWSHGITPRKSDIVPAPNGKGLTLQSRGIRTSFTFRKVVFDRKKKACDLQFNIWTLPMSDVEAKELEKEHVHKVYEDIADHFSGTRYKPWPKVTGFLMDQPPHSLMVDVGCGNGKYLGINKSMFEVGCDYSSNLISICGNRGFQTCIADINCLPFRSCVVDVVLCIAVIHHMSTEKRRLNALTEVLRILQPGGKALLYVWAMEQHHNKKESKYIKSNRQKKMQVDGFSSVANENLSSTKVNALQAMSIVDSNNSSSSLEKADNDSYNSEDNSSTLNLAQSELQTSGDICDEDRSTKTVDDESCTSNAGKPLKIHVNRTQFLEQDMLVPWQLKEKEKSELEIKTDSSVFHRFYHVFKQGELEKLCQSLPQCAVRESYHDQGNWCVILEKLF